MSSALPLDVMGCNGSRSRPVVSLQDPDDLSATPALGPFIFGLETEVEPTENPFERTATVAEMLRRPAVSTEPQMVGPLHFAWQWLRNASAGTFNLTRQEEADEMIKRITAMKVFLKPE